MDATREDVDRVRGANLRRSVSIVLWRCRVIRPTVSGEKYVPTPGGYQNGAELVGGLRNIADFDISVSAYPEKHPESPDFANRYRHVEAQGSNGATRAITQFFAENDLYERYVERVRRAGIYIPIVPGVLPVHNFKHAHFCVRVRQPIFRHGLAERFDGLDNDPQTHQSRRGGNCRRAGDGPDRARCAGFPFLHDEPGRSAFCHLSYDRHKAEDAAALEVAWKKAALPARRAFSFSCAVGLSSKTGSRRNGLMHLFQWMTPAINAANKCKCRTDHEDIQRSRKSHWSVSFVYVRHGPGARW